MIFYIIFHISPLYGFKSQILSPITEVTFLWNFESLLKKPLVIDAVLVTAKKKSQKMCTVTRQ